MPADIEGIHTITQIVERDGQLVATGHNDQEGAIATSDDGLTWVPVDLSATGAMFFSVVPGETGFIAVATRYPVVMGMPEYEHLYSSDGRTWKTGTPPAECVSAGIVALGARYVGLGDRCRGEGDFSPGTLHVLESPDGQSWTTRRDDNLRPGPWATDGGRLVLLQQGDDPAAAFTDAWISDDAAQTWRQVAAPFPEGFNPNGLFYGHDRYIAPASWTGGAGDPQSAVCASADGDAWECEVISEPSEDLAGRNWLGRQVAVTPTGFASLVDYTNDPFFGGDGSTDMVLGTSGDGLSWEFTAVPELKDKLPGGLTWTSHGLYSWGGINRDITPDAYVPYLVVHEAPLP